MKIRDIFKKILWILIYPFFPIGRYISVKLGYNPFPPRQQFHFGYLAAGKTAKELKKHLKRQGFRKNKFGWIDRGEVLSLRLFDTFKYQYHVRLFNDGEICGHHELTPEYSPFGHLRDEETTERKSEFKNFLGDFLSEKPGK
jgi:hypothetical protein